ncbi:DUF192 domain-containing protein [Roseibium sp. HPY-6]|uniref:DUF192 domain-containing protein n=1 Tax=Roseibium sp. HPY-6 TaxID=3229852 RepID=UPI00338F7DF9
MLSKVSRAAAPLIVLVFVVAGFAFPAFAQDAQPQLPQEELNVQSGETAHRFQVEIAATDRQRSRGLMFREEMAADHGMLFIFESEGDRYFWMKNTPLPLDIIYIAANGAIVSIAADTTPFSEKTIPSGAPAQYVLELNAGTAAKLGIDVGDKVSSPSMAAD